MTLGAMDGKLAVELPAVTVVRQAEAGRDSGDGKSRVTRKHVIIAVTCVVVAATVITGILVGVKFFLDSTNDIVKRTYEFKKQDGQTAKEDVSVDMKDNFVQYHLKDDDSEIWVVDDFNRDLQAMKVKGAGGSQCFVATLNRSDNALPQAVLNSTAPTDKVETGSTFYDVSKTAIKDKSLLGTHSQKMCKNIDVYWMTQTCDADDSNELTAGNKRQKRGLCTYLKRVCYWKRSCGWGCWWRYVCYYVRVSCR